MCWKKIYNIWVATNVVLSTISEKEKLAGILNFYRDNFKVTSTRCQIWGALCRKIYNVTQQFMKISFSLS